MPDIKVTSEQLAATASELAATKQGLEAQLAALESKVGSLVDAEWQGAASDSYKQLRAQWLEAAQMLSSALGKLSTMLSENAKAYQETEDQLAQHLRG